MIEKNFTIQTYMKEVQPIVDEVQNSRSIREQFEDSLQLLREEATRCDDNLSIYLAWQDNIGQELHQHYSDTELLQLHGYPRATLIKTDTYHSIIDQDEHVVDFYFCRHRFYTPVTSQRQLNQCLKC